MPILVLLLDSIIVGVFFLSLFVLPSVLRGLFRNKEEYNTVWKRFFNEGRPFTIGGAILLIWGLLGVIGVLLNYSFDKQHGIPTYYTDATLIYSYLPSLITATIGLISWTYFKSLRKKKQEAVVAEPIEEEIPKKASHVVSVKVRKSPDNATISEPIPPVASKVTTASAKTRYCKFCGGQIDPLTKQCSSCGKQYFNFSKTKIIIPLVCVALIVGACVGYSAYNNVRDKQLLSNAMAALENQQFSVALSYFNELPSPEINYPDEYAYACAGLLMEEGKYIEAYKAFTQLNNVDDYKSIITTLKGKLYRQGISLYRSGALSDARLCFSALNGHRDSNKYLELIRLKNINTLYYNEYDKLMSLLDFEDASDVLLNSKFCIKQFLRGRWVSAYDGYYFELKPDGTAHYNLPHEYVEGKYQFYNDGCFSVGNALASSTKIFHFSINTEYSSVGDLITVFCYKDGKEYRLYRENTRINYIYEDLMRAAEQAKR